MPGNSAAAYFALIVFGGPGSSSDQWLAPLLHPKSDSICQPIGQFDVSPMMDGLATRKTHTHHQLQQTNCSSLQGGRLTNGGSYMLNIYQVYDIARSEHAALNVQLSHRWVAGGVRIERPSLLSRIVAALRDGLRSLKHLTRGVPLVTGGAPAK